MKEHERDELLIRMDERLEAVTEKILPNHGVRLASLERWRWMLGGGIVTLGALAGYICTMLGGQMKIAWYLLMLAGAIGFIGLGAALADTWDYWIQDLKDRARRFDADRFHKGEEL